MIIWKIEDITAPQRCIITTQSLFENNRLSFWQASFQTGS